MVERGQPKGFVPMWLPGPEMWLARWLALLCLALLSIAAVPPRVALVLELDGAIGPATVEYVSHGLEAAAEQRAGLVVLRMDTPGGLDSSTREIVRLILSSPVPVATYVSPSGARAASAGTYILTASHVAAMAPGTNVGAATPVAISPQPAPDGEGNEQREAQSSAMEAKAVSDSAAYLRALAKLRGRNIEWADKAVRSSDSLAAHEALETRVVDIVARDLSDLLAQADGRKVLVAGTGRRLETNALAIERFAPGWRVELLSTITDPNVALILMMIGIYGLVFEFMIPGAIAPGVIGAIALLTGLYGLAVLPVNFAGVALILLGLGLMVAEAITPSLGAIGLAGVAAFILGAVMLMPEGTPGFTLDWRVIGSLAATSLAFVLLVARAALSARRRAIVSGREQMIGSLGKVIDWDGSEGHIFAHGERWAARAATPLAPGQPVRVRDLDQLTLDVEPDDSRPNHIQGDGR
jgi:membrane-bound serine protease (ClpP class)